jgi:hypothetical protein
MVSCMAAIMVARLARIACVGPSGWSWQKKERAFFVCPSWKEVAGSSRSTAPHSGGSIRVHGRILAAIEAGQPVARSTLRKALLAMSHGTGTRFDVDALIVDQRTAKPSVMARPSCADREAYRRNRPGRLSSKPARDGPSIEQKDGRLTLSRSSQRFMTPWLTVR